MNRTKKVTLKLDQDLYEACMGAARLEMVDVKTWMVRRLAGVSTVQAKYKPSEVAPGTGEASPGTLLDRFQKEKARKSHVEAPKSTVQASPSNGEAPTSTPSMSEIFKRVGSAKPE